MWLMSHPIAPLTTRNAPAAKAENIREYSFDGRRFVPDDAGSATSPAFPFRVVQRAPSEAFEQVAVIRWGGPRPHPFLGVYGTTVMLTVPVFDVAAASRARNVNESFPWKFGFGV